MKRTQVPAVAGVIRYLDIIVGVILVAVPTVFLALADLRIVLVSACWMGLGTVIAKRRHEKRSIHESR